MTKNEKISRELMKLAKQLMARNVTYEIWQGKDLITQVRAPEGLSVKKIKAKAIRETYLLGEYAEMEPYIYGADVYMRTTPHGPKELVR